MAHYIAELIDDVKKSDDDQRSTKMKACSEAILRLWKYRHELPHGKRPFESLEPILKVLTDLEPENSTPRYFRTTIAAANAEHDKEDETRWLKFASQIDNSAKTLIGYCLAQAARSARNQTARWVALAEEAGVSVDGERSILNGITDIEKLFKIASLEDDSKVELEDLIVRLESYSKESVAIVDILLQQISSLDHCDNED